MTTGRCHLCLLPQRAGNSGLLVWGLPLLVSWPVPDRGSFLTQDVCCAAWWAMWNGKSKRGKIDVTLQDCQEESEMIMFDVVENVLKKTSIDPKKVLCMLLISPALLEAPTLHAGSHPEHKPSKWKLMLCSRMECSDAPRSSSANVCMCCSPCRLTS